MSGKAGAAPHEPSHQLRPNGHRTSALRAGEQLHPAPSHQCIGRANLLQAPPRDRLEGGPLSLLWGQRAAHRPGGTGRDPWVKPGHLVRGEPLRLPAGGSAFPRPVGEAVYQVLALVADAGRAVAVGRRRRRPRRSPGGRGGPRLGAPGHPPQLPPHLLVKRPACGQPSR